MSRASRLRKSQEWFARIEADRTNTRERQNRRAELLQWCDSCPHCGRQLQTIDRNALDYACLDQRHDRILCRGCILGGVQLAQVESEATT